MNRITFVLLFSIAVCSLAGCSSMNKTMASWEGHHQSDLIASWGPPQQVMNDGNGGQIFVYSATRSFSSPGTSSTTVSGSARQVGNTTYGTAYGQTTYNPPQTTSYNAYRMFWIDSNGRVYRWAWKGL